MLQWDEKRNWERLDPSGMRTLIESFPDQLHDAARMASALSLTPPPAVENIVVAGLGGSAIGGDVIRSAFGSRLKVPLIVSRDYRLPGFVGPRSVVIASSYSGNTEETIESYREARQTGAHIVCIASGGMLASLAEADGKPLIRIPGGLPPRAALGYSSISLLGCLTALGQMDDKGGMAVDETVSQLRRLCKRYATGNPECRNPAKKLARSLKGTIPAIYAAAGLLEAAAVRWRGQFEENAKNLAFHHLLPEMNHNELVGWDCPAPSLRRLSVVLLRDHEEHPQVRRRFALSLPILERRSAVVRQVRSQGESRLTRLFSVIYFGDFVSLYLAALNGVDPTPVAVIEGLKARLVRKAAPRAD